MTPENHKTVVDRMRQDRVEGLVVSLEPYSHCHANAVIALRNTERARYFLTQPNALTLESQTAWYEAYLQRDNDIQWVIRDHRGRLVGATALYDIDLEDGTTAEKGRLVVDQEVSRETPIVLEAELLLLSIAFQQLGLAQIMTRVNPDNLSMISINKRLGFEKTGHSSLRGASKVVQTLEARAYRPNRLNQIVQHWRKRIEHGAS